MLEPKRFIKKAIKVVIFTILIISTLILACALTISLVLRMDFAENYLKDLAENYINQSVNPYEAKLKITDLELKIPFSLAANGIDIMDKDGVFAKIDNINLSNDFFSLFRYLVIVPKAGVENIHIFRLPNLTYPKVAKEEENLTSGQFFMPNLENIFNQVADIIFHYDFPTISLENIYADNILLDKNLLLQIRENFINGQVTPLKEEFEQMRLSFNLNSTIDNKLLHLDSNIQLSQDNSTPMTFNTVFTLQKSKEVDFKLNLSDADGIVLNLLEKILNIPFSENDYAQLSMQGTGTFSDFTIDYQADFLNEHYLKKTLQTQGEIGLVPFFITSKTKFAPRFDSLFTSGDMEFNEKKMIN